MTITPAAIYAAGTYFMSESAISLRRRAARHLAGGDKGSLGVIWIVGFASISLAFVAARLFAFADVAVLRQVPAIGAAVFGLGVAWRWYAITHLGRFFTVNVAIAEDHRLVETGPYRWLRHPSYTGWLVAVAGLGLCLGNGLSLVILLTATLGLIVWRIGLEEAVLRAAFGEAYSAYARKTWRLVPFVY